MIVREALARASRMNPTRTRMAMRERSTLTPSRRGVAPTLLALLLLALACIGWSTPAAAHASLVFTHPAEGSLVEAAPERFSITFSEPVSPLVLRVIAPDGGALDLGEYAVKDRTVEIAAPAGLGRGTHVLTWRVVSADGHPVAGSVVFSIGEASAAPPVVEEFDWPVRAGVWVTKVALYVGLFIGIGGAFTLAWLFPGQTPTSPPGRTAVGAALALGVAGAVLSAGFQGLDLRGAPLARLADATVWRAGMDTSLGRSLVVALAGCVLAGAALVARGAPARLLSALALAATGLSLALTGHASAAEPRWLTAPMVFVHAVTIAFWAGTLAPLGLALRRDAPGAGAALERFSRAIPFAVAALLLAGLVLAVIQVAEPAALNDTRYGQILLLKLALVAVLVGLASINRISLTDPALAGERPARRAMARSVAAETAIVVLILGLAAGWRFTPPPRALAIAAAEPVTEYIYTEQALAFIQISPGRAGKVEASVNVLTGEFGILDTKEVTLVLSNPDAGIEASRLPATQAGEANWRIDDLVIPVAGTWRVRVDILITDFDIVRLEGAIAIRP
jgi:copper transport protein